uniref:Uncharacterized protein n=1 Tax=Oryza rufipogon TaxID=4529 RepID=A0A0E0QQZ6_ORYRU
MAAAAVLAAGFFHLPPLPAAAERPPAAADPLPPPMSRRSEVMRRTLFWGEDLMSMEDVQCSKSESFFFYHYCCRGSSISVGMEDKGTHIVLGVRLHLKRITINNSLLLYAGSSAIRLVDVRSSNHRGIPERYAMISLLGGRACLAGPRQSTSVPRRYGEDGIKALPQRIH